MPIKTPRTYPQWVDAAKANLLAGSMEYWLRDMREAAKINAVEAVRDVVQTLKPVDATLPLRVVKRQAKFGAAKFIVDRIDAIVPQDRKFAREALSVALENVTENSALRGVIAHKCLILGLTL